MVKSYLSTAVFLIFSFFTAHSQVGPYKYSQQKKTVTSKAAVVSAHPLASNAGLQMIKQGGNAIDAVIATQLALAVVYPGAGNIGGGGFLVAHLKNGKNISIDYRETAPAHASRDMYLDRAGNAVAELSQSGRLACGVPGTIAGIFACMKYAKLPLKKIIAPAIELAEKGFAITESQAQSFNYAKKEFEEVNIIPVVFVKERLWKAGDTLIQPELAATLKRIRDLGAKGFYEGKTADLIVAEMKRGNGIITKEDLKNYQAKERDVLKFNYKDVQVISMPLPSSGGIIVEQLMKMTDHRNIAAMGFETAASVQLMIEAERRAFADRANFLGDPDFIKVPVEKMVDNEYLRQRMSDFTPGKAGSSDVTKAGMIHESEQTTHISIVDGEGNAVSVTTTLNGGYGSKTVVAGAGFILNNEMDDFSAKPGVPNMYGAVGNAANAIAPNKRMLSSMTPTIVLKNNKPYIVVGTPGGTTIPTSVYQSLMDILEFKLKPEDAVNKPKFHHQWLPDVVDVERDFPKDVLTQLKNMGYKINVRGAIGRTELIVISPRGKRTITAIADKRGDDDARGL
jgi:gamma-glutamyltranspeptidase/glutathione hydrolase